MRNSIELGAEMTRAGLDAAIRIGHQTAEAYRQCAALQAENAGQLLDESVRVTKVLLGDGDTREAIALWGKACEQSLKRTFEASRGLSESALKAQSEMIEAAGNLIAERNRAAVENLEQLARAVMESAAAGSKAAAPTPRAVQAAARKAA